MRSRHADIAAYALSRLSLAADGNACPATATQQLIDRHSDGAYAVLRFTARCPHAPATLDATYRLLFDLDPQHRGLLQLDYARPGAHRDLRRRVPHAEPGSRRSRTGCGSSPNTFHYGVWHIWIGFDHILFLLSLLLPAVLVRKGVAWQPAAGLQGHACATC